MPGKPGFGHTCPTVTKETSQPEIRKKDLSCSEIKFYIQCNLQNTLEGENYTEDFSNSSSLKGWQTTLGYRATHHIKIVLYGILQSLERIIHVT